MKRDPLRLRKAAARAPPAPTQWTDAEEVRGAVRAWAAQMDVRAPRVQLRPMRTEWASLLRAGRITLNTELLGIPKPLGEFVIVHELVQLLAPNHGRVFKSFLGAYLPDWEARELALRAYAGDGNGPVEGYP